MATEEQVARVLMSLEEIVSCRVCETRLRFGDVECPHCGADIEDLLRAWAERLIASIDGTHGPAGEP